eukprot:1743542-Pleurochrysis_carterae.AAC.1
MPNEQTSRTVRRTKRSITGNSDHAVCCSNDNDTMVATIHGDRHTAGGRPCAVHDSAKRWRIGRAISARNDAKKRRNEGRAR